MINCKGQMTKGVTMEDNLPAAKLVQEIDKAATTTKAEDRVSVASNWQLVWWRFRKNKLAVFSSILLMLFYVVVLVPDFFATQDPEATEAGLAFIPMQGISFFDDSGFNLSVPALVGKRNPVTL